MSELIKIVIGVKNPFALFAFLAVVLLLAFRTKAVPELFFQLMREKLTRERFAQLVHRFMVLTFAAFVALCAIAVIGQVLAVYADARPSVDAFRREVAGLHVEQANSAAAAKAYEDALAAMAKDHLDDAIASLQASISAVPTVTANLTLAQLYDKKHLRDNAKQATAAASMLADARGDALGSIKANHVADELHQSEVAADPSGNSRISGSPFIGPHKRRFPAGAANYEDAPVIVPDTYIGSDDLPEGVTKYYKLSMKAGQTLTVVLRHRDRDAGWSGVSMRDKGGFNRGAQQAWGPSDGATATYKAEEGGWAYVGLYGATKDTVYAINVQ